MKFYKVKSDNQYWNENGEYIGFVVENELITPSEMKKRKLPITNNFFLVEVKKTNTYWFFGCRFENKCD
ncbi:MAG: hypothetical protein IKF91_03210 [Bacilli bacterium]|nr:hypothetical protein [Bacilli bacterium]